VKIALFVGIAAAGLLTAACGSSAASNAPAASGTTAPASSTASAPAGSADAAKMTAILKTEHTSLGTVLATSKGYTLYYFAKDTATSSACTGACAAAWPPVTGTPQLMSGVTLPDKLTTITRSGGQLQVEYDGHPLYTYAGDSAPGMASGNGINGFGGLWWAIKIGGSSSSSSGGSGSSGGGGW
jgi:predicted lipoprotein with Yx(FWY)xxD motif